VLISSGNNKHDINWKQYGAARHTEQTSAPTQPHPASVTLTSSPLRTTTAISRVQYFAQKLKINTKFD